MKIVFKQIVSIISFSLVLSSGAGIAGEKVPVFVSIVPQKYFVQQIGKDRVDVRVMVQPGASPATYEPKPKQMVNLSKARIYFAIGVPFEKTWLKKIVAANPNMEVVHTDQGIAKVPMSAHPAGERVHAAGEHGHGVLDPHIWLSPPLVKQQARTVLSALGRIDPAHKNDYAANYRLFAAEIDALDAKMKAMFKGKRGLRFMVFHPAWGYFAQAYGLRQVPIEIEGKNPKPARLKELIEHARVQGIKIVFVQPQFSSKSAELVAREIGAQVAFANPLAENWLENLHEVADKFEAALK